MKLIEIGILSKTHGFRGGFTADFFVDTKEELSRFENFYFSSGKLIKIKINSNPEIIHKTNRLQNTLRFRIQIEGIDTAGEASTLRGQKIYVEDSLDTNQSEVRLGNLMGLRVIVVDEELMAELREIESQSDDFKHTSQQKQEVEFDGEVIDVADFGQGTMLLIKFNDEKKRGSSLFLHYTEERFPHLDLDNRIIYMNDLDIIEAHECDLRPN